MLLLFFYHNTVLVPRKSIEVRTEEFLITPLSNHLIFVNEYRELFRSSEIGGPGTQKSTSRRNIRILGFPLN